MWVSESDKVCTTITIIDFPFPSFSNVYVSWREENPFKWVSWQSSESKRESSCYSLTFYISLLSHFYFLLFLLFPSVEGTHKRKCRHLSVREYLSVYMLVVHVGCACWLHCGCFSVCDREAEVIRDSSRDKWKMIPYFSFLSLHYTSFRLQVVSIYPYQSEEVIAKGNAHVYVIVSSTNAYGGMSCYLLVSLFQSTIPFFFVSLLSFSLVCLWWRSTWLGEVVPNTRKRIVRNEMKDRETETTGKKRDEPRERDWFSQKSEREKEKGRKWGWY